MITLLRGRIAEQLKGLKSVRVSERAWGNSDALPENLH